MKSKTFLKEKLKKLSLSFPFISFKYEYNSYSNTHIIEVLPYKEYENNEKYLDEEAELTYEFDNAFFPESVMFVSENSLIRVNNPELVFPVYDLININDTVINNTEVYEKISFNNYIIAA